MPLLFRLLPLLLNLAFTLPLFLKAGKAGKVALSAAKLAPKGLKAAEASTAAKEVFKGFGVGDAVGPAIGAALAASEAKNLLTQGPLEEASQLEASFGEALQQQSLSQELKRQRAISSQLDDRERSQRALASTFNPTNDARDQLAIQALVDKAMVDHQELLGRTVQKPEASIADLYHQFGGL